LSAPKPIETIEPAETNNSNSAPYPQPIVLPQKQERGRPRKYLLLIAVADITINLQNTQFGASCQKELAGLLEKGVFEIIKLANIPQGVQLFNLHFVDKVKNIGTNKAFEKSRLVI